MYRAAFMVYFLSLCIAIVSAPVTAATVIEYAAPAPGLKADIERQIVDTFNQTHKDVQVNFRELAWNGDEKYFEQIAVWAAGGVTPDVFKVTPPNLAAVARRGWLMDLTPLVTRDALQMGFDDFLVAGPGYRDGRHYVLSYRIGYAATNVNLDRFDEAGFPSPFDTYRQGGWNWDFLRVAAAKMTKKGSDDRPRAWGYGLQGWNRLADSAWLQSAGGQWFTSDESEAVFDSPEAVRALAFLRDLVVSGVAPGRNALGLDYNKGDYAISTSSQGLPGGYTGDWRTEVLPHFAGPGAGPLLATSTVDDIAIASLSTKKEAAWEFLKFYTSREMTRLWIAGFRIVPNRKSLLREYIPIMKEQWQLSEGPALLAELLGANQTVPQPLPEHGIDFRNILTKTLYPGLFGEQPLENTVKEAVRLTNAAAPKR